MNWSLQTIKSKNTSSVYNQLGLFYKEQCNKLINQLSRDDLPQEPLKHSHDYKVKAKKLKH